MIQHPPFLFACYSTINYTYHEHDNMSKRYKIAYLTRGVAAGVGYMMWKAIRATAKQHNIDLIVLDGGNLGQDTSLIHDLAAHGAVDGIVSWAASEYSSYLVYYQQRFANIPMISVTLPVDGYPVVKIDSYSPFKKAIKHLIEVHGHQKIAYIRGTDTNNYFAERFRAYKDALSEHGITYSDQLVTEPYSLVEEKTGNTAIAEFLDKRALIPGRDFTALVAVTEPSTMGAIYEFKLRGVRIPQDVAMTGFDNSVTYRGINPKVTSIINPFAQQTSTAFETLLEMLQGNKIAPVINLDARLEINQSCGCQSRSTQLAKLDVDGAQAGDPGGSKQAWADSLFKMFRSKTVERSMEMEDVKKLLMEDCKHFLDRFLIETGIDGISLFPAINVFVDVWLQCVKTQNPDNFLPAVDGLLDLCASKNIPINFVQDIFSIIRRGSLSIFQAKRGVIFFEDLWGIARVRVAEVTMLVEQVVSVQTEKHFNTLRDFIRVLSGYFETGPLFTKLTEWLPKIQVPGCYIVVYNEFRPFVFLEPMCLDAHLLYAFQDGKRVDMPASGLPFLTKTILPDQFMINPERLDLYISPMIFSGKQLGYVIVENGPDNRALYSAMAGQLSNSMQGATFLKESMVAEQKLHDTLGKVLSKASIVTNSSQHISDLVHEISFTMESLTTDIRRILSQAVEVMSITRESVGLADNASSLIDYLYNQSNKIMEINGIITDITDRTRLLSINAGIEAARAHEAGKGFIPIAQEVKKLAEETGRSTIHINEMIESIRSSAGDARKVIESMVGVTNKINLLSQDIEQAVSRHMQGSTAISEKLVHASNGTKGISSAISELQM